MATIVFIFTLIFAGKCWADTSAADYVYWKKADITAWHLYFPSRALDGEGRTNRMAVEAIIAMNNNMYSSLEMVVRYPMMEQNTAMFMMEGTQAQGCINGVSSFLSNAITDAATTYKDCSADAQSSLNRLYSAWGNILSNYLNVYQKSMTGIDSCANAYPNKESESRMKSCVDAWAKKYYSAASSTLFDTFNSPAMGKFKSIVVPCAEAAAATMVEKGEKLLNMLVQCAKLSNNVDSDSYRQEIFNEYQNYRTQNDLGNQIALAENTYGGQIANLEGLCYQYYQLKKTALETYVIESRSKDFYAAMVRRDLQKYYITEMAAIEDNPENAACSVTRQLDAIVETGSEDALTCDETVVNDTKRRFDEINDSLLALNFQTPSYGNPAILSCFIKGYIFQENTIWNCFRLTSSELAIKIQDTNDKVANSVDVLRGYEKSFFDSSTFPCGELIVRNLTLDAERALYELERCMYMNSGEKYEVTTSSDAGSTTDYSSLL